MKSTCIHHPAKETLILIRKWQLKFCDSDHCAAALLSYFEYWHNIKLELSQRARQANELARKHGKPATHDESLLQFHTDEDLRVGLLGLYGTMKIRSGRHLLVAKGAITEHPNPTPRYAFDKTIYYLFHDEVVNTWLARYSSDLSSAKNGERVAKNGAQFVKKTCKVKHIETPAYQITTEITTETTTTTTQNAPQNEHARWPEEPGGSSSNLNLISNFPANEEVLLTGERVSLVSGEVSLVSERVSPTSKQGKLNQQELIFDLNLANYSPEDRAHTVKLLEGLDTKTAQQVLDEFNEVLGSKSIKKSRWAWLRQVAQAAREGTFQPTADLGERRRKQHQVIATQPPARKPSQVWEEHREELLHDGIKPADYHTYIAPLHGREDGKVLWLEAPNNFVADWVRARMPQIEQAMKVHTTLPIQICIG